MPALSPKPTRFLGPANAPFNVLVVAEGFTGLTMPEFHNACDNRIAPAVRGEAWYKKGNVASAVAFWKCALKSGKSGQKLTFPGACPAGVTYANAIPSVSFQTEFGSDGCETVRPKSSLVQAWAAALSEAWQGVPAFNMHLVLVRFPAPAGLTQGTVAAATVTAGVANWALHELGHCFGLDDEYEPDPGVADQPAGGGASWDGINNICGYTQFTSDLRTPWGETLLSAPLKVNCTAIVLASGGVGVYEGANNFHCLSFRPAPTCRMRLRHHRFCPICRDVIANTLDPTSVSDPTYVA